VTPQQLYFKVPKRSSHEIGRLKGYRYNHVAPELNDWDVLPYEDPYKRIELRYYEDQNIDGRRIGSLASVWYAGRAGDVPFMIVQNAGREGDDWARRIITDVQTYRDAARYLKSLCMVQEEPDDISKDVFDANAEVQDLTAFYGREWKAP
jgi:hypothetical protein